MDKNSGAKRIVKEILIIILGAISGHLLFGYFWFGAFIACLALLIWHHYLLDKLSDFLAKSSPDRKVDPPEISPYYEIARSFTQQSDSYNALVNISKATNTFKEVFKQFPDAAVLLDKDNNILWSNQSAKTLLGIDVTADRNRQLTRLIPEPELLKLLSKYKPSKKAALHTIIDSPKKLDRYISAKIIPLKNSEKMLICSDVSEQINTQIMRQDFVANASHELRTPLTVINGYLESMLDNMEMMAEGDINQIPVATIQPPMQTMYEQSRRMTNLINDLLLLSKVENGDKKTFDTTAIDMEQVIKQLVTDAQRLSGERGHQIASNIKEKRQLLGNTTMLQALVSNLVYNAVNHTDDETCITISWEPTKENGARLVVADNGQGIPKQHLPRITERFYRVDKSRSRNSNEQQTGTGLGLAIVRHAVANLDGKLEVDSELGEGTTFTCAWSEASLS